jgi:hypothetical protein
MKISHFIVATAVSSVVALLMLLIVAWITGGAYSSNKVGVIDLALVLPMLIAAKLGLDRLGALATAFLTYFALIFAYITWYILRGNPR